MTKSKEEILKTELKAWRKDLPFDKIYEAMQEYSDQSNTALVDEIEALRKERDEYKSICDEYRADVWSGQHDSINTLQSQLKEANEKITLIETDRQTGIDTYSKIISGLRAENEKQKELYQHLWNTNSDNFKKYESLQSQLTAANERVRENKELFIDVCEYFTSAKD